MLPLIRPSSSAHLCIVRLNVWSVKAVGRFLVLRIVRNVSDQRLRLRRSEVCLIRGCLERTFSAPEFWEHDSLIRGHFCRGKVSQISAWSGLTRKLVHVGRLYYDARPCNQKHALPPPPPPLCVFNCLIINAHLDLGGLIRGNCRLDLNLGYPPSPVYINTINKLMHNLHIAEYEVRMSNTIQLVFTYK